MSLKEEIKIYLCCFDAKMGIGKFTDLDARGAPDPKRRRSFWYFLDLRFRHPREPIIAESADRLQAFYDGKIQNIERSGLSEDEIRRGVEEFHRKLVKSGVSFLAWKGDSKYGKRLNLASQEGRRKIEGLYLRSRTPPESTEQSVTRRISVTFDKPDVSDIAALIKWLLAQYPDEERRFYIGKIAADAGFGLVDARFECITIDIEVRREIAERLLEDFRLERTPPEIIMVREAPTTRHSLVPLPRPAHVSNTSFDDEEFARWWRRIQLRQSIIEPWRRLRWLLSPIVSVSPISHNIYESGNRAYATRRLLAVWEPNSRFILDLATAWVLWPILSAVLIAATLFVLRPIMPNISISDGLTSGIVVALFGGQVCSFVVAPIAAGAGGIFIAWGFGVVQAIISARIGSNGGVARSAIENDFFTAVTGGPIGLSAPQWRGHFWLIEIVLMVMVIAGAIAAAGWLMCQPTNAGPFSPTTVPYRMMAAGRWFRANLPDGLKRLVERAVRIFVQRTEGSGGEARTTPAGKNAFFGAFAPLDFLGGAVGALVGASMGIIFGLNVLLNSFGLSSVTAFTLAYGVVGSTVFSTTIWLAKKSARRNTADEYGVAGDAHGEGFRDSGLGGVALYAVLYFIVVAVMSYVAVSAPATIGFLALFALTGVYQATWFTGAWALGTQFSSRAAAIATTLEGAVGFSGFMVFRMLHG